MSQSISTAIRFSTDELPADKRLEIFCDQYARTIIKADMDPVADYPFHFDAVLCALPGVGIAAGTISPTTGVLKKALIDSDDVLFNITLSGARVLRQRGREAIIGPGQGCATTSADPGIVTVLEPSRFLSFRVPRHVLQPMVGDLDASLVQTIPRESNAMRLLASYAQLIEASDALADFRLRDAVTSHFYDLISLTLGARRDAAVQALGRGVPAARLRAIKRDIMANLGLSELSMNAVSRRHGITPRYLRMLFAAEDTSYTAFVLAGRLDRAAAMLRDPAWRYRRIADIAFACGFGDLSYFNRVFRRRYGATPSDIREAARRENL